MVSKNCVSRNKKKKVKNREKKLKTFMKKSGTE